MPTPPPTPLPDAAAGQLSAMQDTEPQDPEHDLLICAMHFIGDGMALHTSANEFFGLLGSDADDAALRAVLEDEWQARWGRATDEVSLSLGAHGLRLSLFLIGLRVPCYRARWRTRCPCSGADCAA